MKSFLKKKWHRMPVGIVMVVMALMLVAGTVFAAWNPTTLNSTGSITVGEERTWDFSFNPTTLDFGNTTAYVGEYYEAYATVVVTNNGNQSIGSFSVTPIGLPSWVAAGYAGLDGGTGTYPLLQNETQVIDFILSGIPTGEGTLDLATISFEFTAHS